MKHPHVFCQLESVDKIYRTKDYELHQERQRPTVGYFELEEPIEKNCMVILELGYNSRAFRITMLQIESCAQVAEKTFDVVAIEATKEILQAPFVDQLMGVNMESALKKLCKKVGLTLNLKGEMPKTKPKNLMLISTVRSAFDQIWEVFNLRQARWSINLLTKEFTFLSQGKMEIDPIDIPMKYFKKETAGGLEMEIVPMLKPYTPVKWREQEEIIDVSRMNSKTRTMFINFASAV